jgi:hypothetical protein
MGAGVRIGHGEALAAGAELPHSSNASATVLPMAKRRSLLIAFAVAALPAAAHHSIAIYDIDQSIYFDGVVETVKLSNPHLSLTLTITKGDGTTGTIRFIEGAPAGMLVRMGLDPADVAVGKPIKAIGAPLRDDANSYFLKAIILPNGRRFTFME